MCKPFSLRTRIVFKMFNHRVCRLPFYEFLIVSDVLQLSNVLLKESEVTNWISTNKVYETLHTVTLYNDGVIAHTERMATF